MYLDSATLGSYDSQIIYILLQKEKEKSVHNLKLRKKCNMIQLSESAYHWSINRFDLSLADIKDNMKS